MKQIIIVVFFVTSCTGLRDVHDSTKIQPLTDQTVSSLNGNYRIFSPGSEAITLDHALTIKSYWWKDWADKYKYSVSLTAKDSCHLKVEVYKEDVLLDTKLVKGKVKDGYFIVKPKKILFFYFLLNGYGQVNTRIGRDTSGNLLVDSHHFKFATLVVIPLTGDRRTEYGLVFPRKR